MQLYENAAVKEEEKKTDCSSSVTGHGGCNRHEDTDGGGGDRGTGLSMPTNSLVVTIVAHLTMAAAALSRSALDALGVANHSQIARASPW